MISAIKCRLKVLLVLAVLPYSARADERVTVMQLEQTVGRLHGISDGDLAQRLFAMQLTERIDSQQLARLASLMAGDKSRHALIALGDQSAFLSPSSSELPPAAAPGLSEQRRIMGRVIAYVSKTIPRLPNFFATRRSVHFQDTPMRNGPVGTRFAALHTVGTSSATVLYKDGREVLENGAAQLKKAPEREQGLRTWGEFGQILSTVLLDAAQSRLEWSRWEKGESGQLAVFEYSVPREKSHYDVVYCCVLNSEETHATTFHEAAGYHGEMTVDTETGAILRISIEADLRPSDPIAKAAILVEYSSVQIGGKSYICPVHSIAISRAPSLTEEKDILVPSAPHSGAGGGGVSVVHTRSLSPGPEQTFLNDVAFVEYHVFRSDVRFMTGISAESEQGSPPSDVTEAVSPGSDRGTPAQNASSTAVIASPISQSPAEPLSSTALAAPLPPAVSATQQEGHPPAEAASDISAMPTPELPKMLRSPQPTEPKPGLMLRITSRLVDVGVIALDKKGNPVTDLKSDDFEIYDNGRKQQINFFSHADDGIVPTQSGSHSQQALALDEMPISNLPTPERKIALSGQITILLIDASNVSFSDLAHVRQQILRFLKSASTHERVGLYILRSHGFQILVEPSFNHVQVASALVAWMPSAQDLAHAQEQEQRNRQQFEWVHKATDLAYVNGNANIDPSNLNPASDPSGKTIPDYLFTSLDPKLRDLGDNPERDSLGWLAQIARHLGAYPGHKNLVWVTSDNVLADWSNLTMRAEKTGKLLDPLALKAQEALNQVHVSLYPLDASQIEAGGTGADIGTRNILPVGRSDRDEGIKGDLAPGIKSGRDTARMQQDTRSIQGMFRDLAEATGGHALRRASDISAELDSILNDGRAACLLSFTPNTPADNAYHHIVVKVTDRPNVTLRYRTGYFYAKEPLTPKERFQQAVWQAADIPEIGLSASPFLGPNGGVLKLTITTADLALAHQGDLWIDSLDIFTVERDDAALHARLGGQTLALQLKQATYEKNLKEGLTVEIPLHVVHESGDLRVIVADRNAGRIGTLTIPSSRMGENR